MKGDRSRTRQRASIEWHTARLADISKAGLKHKEPHTHNLYNRLFIKIIGGRNRCRSFVLIYRLEMPSINID